MAFFTTCFPRQSSAKTNISALRLSMIAVVLLCMNFCVQAQTKYKESAWWFGLAGGANFNFYSGSTQRANEVTYFPTAFGSGDGTRIFGLGLIEYHIPKSVIGFMLHGGVDDRSAEFSLPDQKLEAHLGYITIEPSLRVGLPKSFYIYGGPRFGFLAASDFTYKRKGFPDYPDHSVNPDAKLYISSVRKNPISAQIGAGYDFRFNREDKVQFVVSPFVSYFPTMWRKNIRSIDRLYLQTIRAGVALKVGKGRLPPAKLPLPPYPTVMISDRDGDKIFDLDDNCPDTFGFARYQGCPIPDRDRDGINDEEDRCPDVFGFARYQGCPIPDTDKDGLNDEIDKCPTRPGPASNQGCPVIARQVIDRINFAAKNVFFATGSYKLLPKSFKSLDDVANLMKEDPSLMIDIDGHTDSQGSDEKNTVLSDDRAAAVKNYLVGVGVNASRLKSAGYGESRPVADNKTAVGRAQNRRTEMTVRNF